MVQKMAGVSRSLEEIYRRPAQGLAAVGSALSADAWGTTLPFRTTAWREMAQSEDTEDRMSIIFSSARLMGVELIAD